MTNDLNRAIATMLQALNVRTEPERVRSFADAIAMTHLCEACAVIACGRLATYMTSRPVPNHLAMETREVMAEEAHSTHLTAKALGSGDGARWWQETARAAILAEWPDCPSPGWVADQMRTIGIIRMEVDAVRVDVGRPGTTERAWWERHAERNLEGAS